MSHDCALQERDLKPFECNASVLIGVIVRNRSKVNLNICILLLVLDICTYMRVLIRNR